MTLTMSWAKAQRAIGRPATTRARTPCCGRCCGTRCRTGRSIVPSMEEQHHGIEAALHDVNALVSAWQSTAQDGENLAAALDALLDRLQEHMALEEKEILPLAEKFVTAAEWARLGEHALSETPKKDLPLGLGMSHTRRAWPPVWPTPPSRSAVRSGSRSSRPSPTAAPKACSTPASTARPWR